MASAYTRRTVVTAPGVGTFTMLAPNPRRIAIIVPALAVSPAQVTIGPFPNPADEYLGAVNNTQQRFTLFDWLTLVTDQWFVYSGFGAVSFPVYEILTQ
jgi:hypothetical protein